MNRNINGPKRTAALLLAFCAFALTQTAQTVQADGTACVVPPADGPMPEHVREARRAMKEFRPAEPGGWVRRASRAYENARRIERGEMSLEEAEGAGGRAVTGTLNVAVLPILYSDVAPAPVSSQALQNQLFDGNASRR